jgi:hypothetical protein
MSAMLIRCILLLCMAAALGAQAPARHDVVKGRVTTDSGGPVVDADVIVTMAPTREVVRGKSDSSGGYSLTLANGTGEYLLYIGAVGRIAFRKRLTATGADSTFVVDAKLAPVPVTTLAAVRSVAQRNRPPRTGTIEDRGSGLSAGDKTPDGVFGQISPDLAGNLEAMASVLPGYAMTPGGLSAGGMTGANLSTLNGLSVGAELPRDAKTSARFMTSPWDPTRGGFAGAQLAQSLIAGGAIDYKRARVTLDAPTMQMGQPGATSLGQKYRSGIVTIGGDGPIIAQKYFYNYSVEASRTTTPVASLLDLDPLTLEQNGVSADSAQRLINAVTAQGIPLSLGGIPGDRQTTSGSFVTRIDKSSQPSRTPGGMASAPWWILAAANMRKSDALSLSPSMIPSATTEQRSGGAALQGYTSIYIGPGRLWLNEVMAAISTTTNKSDPYLGIPSGSVRVASALDDGSSTVRSLSVGGGSSPRRDEAWSAELVNNTTFYQANKLARPIKLHLTGRYDSFDQIVGGSRLGSYSFASISDFENNQPSSFSRALRIPDRKGGELSGASALGFNWTLKQRINLIGGLRAEGNVFTKTPEWNPAVESVLGVRTDHVPNTFAISPRLGFSWTYKGPVGFSSRFGPTAGVNYAPITVRGGFGRFRNRLAPTLIADALTGTGLSGSTLQISCFGPAAPTPDWDGYINGTAAIPAGCATGFDPVYSDTAANIVAFAQHYKPQDAWRANLGSTRTFFGRTYISADVFYSMNSGQPSSLDRNFSGISRTTLFSENSRPVFVSRAGIVPSTGVVSPVESRTSNLFGRVMERQSDMQSNMKQVVLHTIPNTKWFDPFLAVDYVYTDTRVKRRGFDGNTSGDPRVAEWMQDAFTSRHQINLQLGKSYKRVALTGIVIFRSGTLYTPMVGGDINGDGQWNDRAFVYGPTPQQVVLIGPPIPVTADTATGRLRSEMANLIAGAPDRIRDCLVSSTEQIAAANSCRGPWTATMNAYLSTTPNLPRIGRRMTVSMNFANPLALADRVLHGADDLRGWGGQAYPEQTLLYVRGYDSTRYQFRYEVNQRFGSTSPRTNAILNPFRVTLDMKFNLGRSVERQQVDITLRPPRNETGSRASMDTIRTRLLLGSGATGPQDIYGAILYFRDSLALSADQIRRLEEARVPFRAKIDSMYSDLARQMVALPNGYDGASAAAMIKAVNDSAWAFMGEQGKPIQSILSSTQIQLLWPPIVATLTKPNINSRWAGVLGGRWIP